MSLRILFATLIAAAGVLYVSTPAMAATTCTSETFGVEKANLCTGEKCRFFTPPEEIQRISRGVYAEFVGLFINDGIASWLGFDVEKSELIEVRRFAGRRLGNAPRFDTTTQYSYTRETKTDRVHWIDVVRKRPVAENSLDELICGSNHLWTAKWIPPRRVTDVHNELFLIDRGAIKSFGGMGDLDGEARVLREILRSLRDPSWGN